MKSMALLTNVKFSVKCSPISLHTVSSKALEAGYTVIHSNNFLVLKNYFCCTIFNRRAGTPFNHVNVTKIRRLCDITKVLKELENIGVCCRSDLLVIDNITGQLDTRSTVNIRKLVGSKQIKTFLERYTDNITLKIKYHNEKFPGAFLKIFKGARKLGTSIVFHSGKVVFVGSKSEKDLKCLALLTHVIILLKF